MSDRLLKMMRSMMVVSIRCDGWVLNGLSFGLSYPQVFHIRENKKQAVLGVIACINKTTLICNIPSALQESEKVQTDPSYYVHFSKKALIKIERSKKSEKRLIEYLG